MEGSNIIILATNRAPGSAYKSKFLKYIALDDQYSVYKNHSRFLPTRMSVFNFENAAKDGVENLTIVS